VAEALVEDVNGTPVGSRDGEGDDGAAVALTKAMVPLPSFIASSGSLYARTEESGGGNAPAALLTRTRGLLLLKKNDVSSKFNGGSKDARERKNTTQHRPAREAPEAQRRRGCLARVCHFFMNKKWRRGAGICRTKAWTKRNRFATEIV
jgi:hypothetical protein